MKPGMRVARLSAITALGILVAAPVAGQMPPGNVTVRQTGASATIAWTGVRTAIGYRVLRALDSRTRGQDLTVPLAPQVTSFVDATVVPGAGYFYQVLAINPDRSESPSQLAPFSMPAGPMITAGPLAAGPVTATIQGKTSNQLSAVSNVVTSRSAAGRTIYGVPPTITALSQPKAYPNQAISILGSSLGSVTSVSFVPVAKPYGTWAPVPGTQAVSVTPTHVDAGRVEAGVPLGSTVGPQAIRWSFGNGQALWVVAVGAHGVDTADVPLIVDKTPVIAAVEEAKVPAGQTLRVTGYNLELVDGAYIGQGTRGTAENPKLTTVPFPNGTGVVVTTEATCNREDYLLLETTSALAPLVSSQFKVRCAIQPEVTTITPMAGPPGTVVQLQGKGFRNVIGVSSTVVPNLTWSRPTDPSQADTRLLVTLPPPLPGYGGAMSVSLALTTDVKYLGSVSHFPLNQYPVVLAPPQITNTIPAYGEPGMWIGLQGSALSAPPQIVPKVKVNGVTATLSPGYSGNYLMFSMPFGTTGGPITVETAGGTATLGSPFIFVTGQSDVTHMMPAAGTQGDAVTVHGTNLARAGGICTRSGGTTGDWVYWHRVGGAQSATSNTEISVVVPPLWQGTQSFPVHLLLPGNPANHGQQMCNPTPTAVQFQRQP